MRATTTTVLLGLIAALIAGPAEAKNVAVSIDTCIKSSEYIFSGRIIKADAKAGAVVEVTACYKGFPGPGPVRVTQWSSHYDRYDAKTEYVFFIAVWAGKTRFYGGANCFLPKQRAGLSSQNVTNGTYTLVGAIPKDTATLTKRIRALTPLAQLSGPRMVAAMRPAGPPLTEAQTTALETHIRRLGDKQWAARTKAQKALSRYGPNALPLFRAAHAKAEDNEVKSRLGQLISRFDLYEKAEKLRVDAKHRALFAKLHALKSVRALFVKKAEKKK